MRLGALTPVPIRSHTQQRAHPYQTVEKPEVGMRWGAEADFDFMRPGGDDDSERNGGVTLIRPRKRTLVDRFTRFTPGVDTRSGAWVASWTSP